MLLPLWLVKSTVGLYNLYHPCFFSSSALLVAALKASLNLARHRLLLNIFLFKPGRMCFFCSLDLARSPMSRTSLEIVRKADETVCAVLFPIRLGMTKTVRPVTGLVWILGY